jgi:outer membrane protein TolC
LEAQQDSSDKKADRLAALEGHLGRMKDLRKITEERYTLGHAIQADVLAADYYIAEATLWLAQAKTK